MKRLLIMIGLVLALVRPVCAAEIPITSRAGLLMEKTTGQVLFAQNEHERLEPASVTKIMTVLLTMEAIDRGAIALDDVVTASANAAGMGGSQVYLSEGEQITVEELLKCVCVASGNDAAVALAEHVAGVTELFIQQMNNRAAELGMKDTHFVNCTGLPAEGHVTSAHDIAIMSRELLLHHPEVKDYTTIWMDTIRDGTFGLSNTNKLVRFYEGCTGLKTGYTSQAGYSMSATAERDGMELIAVIMKGETSDKRNTDAKSLLNYGFSTYSLADVTPQEPLPALPVTAGKEETVALMLPQEGCTLLRDKGAGELTQQVIVPESVKAPVAAGDEVGTLVVCEGDREVLRVPLLAAADVEKLTFGETLLDLLCAMVFFEE